jgi:hypothetical protein
MYIWAQGVLVWRQVDGTVELKRCKPFLVSSGDTCSHIYIDVVIYIDRKPFLVSSGDACSHIYRSCIYKTV